MGTGAEFVKKLKPAGCALFLIMGIIVTVMLFTVKTPDEYSPPESGEYYALHLDELKQELEENLLPRLELSDVVFAVTDGRLAVTVPADKLETAKEGITQYFDESLFEFIERE